MSAEGYGTAEGTPSLRRVEIRAGDVIEAAAIVVGAVVRGILEGQEPAGLLTQREALNPSLLLNDLQKRGLEVSVSERAGHGDREKRPHADVARSDRPERKDEQREPEPLVGCVRHRIVRVEQSLEHRP